MLRRASGGALVAGLVALVLPGSALALDSTQAKGRAELTVRSVAAKAGQVQALAARARKPPATPARRVAEGDILLRNKDYERAINVLSQVLELHRQHKASAAANADALALLAESYFQDRQYLSARRHFRDLLDRAGDSTYAPYAGRALSRLVDVCLRTNDHEGVDELLEQLSRLPNNDADGSLQYARGKVFFAKADHGSATGALRSVPAGSRYALQAQYLLGVVLTKQAAPAPPPPEPETEAPGTAEADPEGATPPAPEESERPAAAPDYAAAIEQFRKVTRLPAKTSTERHVADLAWMAIGRLFYESDNYLDAAEAYSHVDRKSPEFSSMLYELAWVYVRLGDYQRAERALEVQRITDPENLQIADGALLRADLMLRTGKFDKASNLYRSVRSRFDPIREQVERFISATTDPAVYYDRLVEEQFAGGEKPDVLPAMVLEWAREEAEDERVFAVIDDVTRSRDLVKQARELVTKLNAVLSSRTQAKAFPQLQGTLEIVLGLLNQLGRARRTLALGMDDEAGARVRGQLRKVRAKRRALMRRMEWLPVEPGDFSRRDDQGERQWNRLSQQLQRLQLQADKLQAIVNGLKRVLEHADQHGVTPDAQSRQRFAAEVDANEQDLAVYRARMRQYRRAVDMGRVQIGFGDQRFVVDDRVRDSFREVFALEVALVVGGADNPDAADYARSVQPVLEQADRIEAQLLNARRRIEQAVKEHAAVLGQQVAREASLLEQYAASLDTLDQEARLLVGEVAMRNFALVRDRLKSIVLRADVGIVQEAWEVREEQRIRVRNLHRERSREEQQLNDELREVLDDAGDNQ